MSVKRPQAWPDLMPCLVTTILLLLPYIHAGLFEFNYTGLLNSSHAVITWLSLIPVYVYYLFLFYSHTKNKRGCCLLSVLTFCTMITPYSTTGGFFSSLHLLLCFLSFLYLQKLLFNMLLTNAKLLRFYLAGLLPCFLIAVTYLSINGLCEVLYGLLLLVVLKRA